MSEENGEVVGRAITEFNEPQYLSDEGRAWVTSGVPSPMCPPHVYEFEEMAGYAKPGGAALDATPPGWST